MIKINNIVLVGRLTTDPELKFTPGKGTPVVNLSLAVDKFINGEKKADFLPCVIYGKNAENVANYMTKGSQIGVQGRLNQRHYLDGNGKKRYVLEVMVEKVQFLGNSNKGTVAPNGFDNGMDDMTPVDDGDVPF